jgi:ferredoxin--NADP+ reductase
MYKIIKKRVLNSQVKLFEVFAPAIAQKAQPGQFVIIRIDGGSERVPFTIADTDAARGAVTFIMQEAGMTTRRLGALAEGDSLMNFAGPLGRPTEFRGRIDRAIVIGGGLGCAIAYPQAKNLFRRGARVDTIVGFRSADLVILEGELRDVSSRLHIMTDDGSYGGKGFVTQALAELLGERTDYDAVVAIGPAAMMKAVSEMTRPKCIQTIVSLNPIMVDGTGMCGCCRVTVAGRTRFTCVDGPDFNGHEVNFDELMKRSAMYRDHEKMSLDRHICMLESAAAAAAKTDAAAEAAAEAAAVSTTQSTAAEGGGAYSSAGGARGGNGGCGGVVGRHDR